MVNGRSPKRRSQRRRSQRRRSQRRRSQRPGSQRPGSQRPGSQCRRSQCRRSPKPRRRKSSRMTDQELYRLKLQALNVLNNSWYPLSIEERKHAQNLKMVELERIRKQQEVLKPEPGATNSREHMANLQEYWKELDRLKILEFEMHARKVDDIEAIFRLGREKEELTRALDGR
jgi:hypothetical protein